MKGLMALITFTAWLIWFYYYHRKEHPAVSSGAWIVLVWLFIHGTRPLTAWLGLEGNYNRDEGNPEEALVNLVLIIAGLSVLLRRRIRWLEVITSNKFLFVCYLFWAASVLWSDYPLITIKRLFKEMGDVFMVLIVLTDRQPAETLRVICVRFAYICIPLSIILIRYYPQMGRHFVGYHRDVIQFTGITTQKNLLGVLIVVSILFILWEIFEQRERSGGKGGVRTYMSNWAVLGMCGYLLVLINSATALVCAMLGSGLLFLLSLSSLRNHPIRMEIIAGGIGLITALFDSVFEFRKNFVESLGRNMSLTSRTEIWEIVLSSQDNWLVGQGFETFWAGERLRVLAERTLGIIQAHNGYIETYLNGGLIGVSLLCCLILVTYKRLRENVKAGMQEDRMRYVILIVALVYNYTEASFYKLGPLWFVTLCVIMVYSAKQSSRQSGVLLRQNLNNGLAKKVLAKL